MDSERTDVLNATDFLSTKSPTQRRTILGTRWKGAYPQFYAGGCDHNKHGTPNNL